MFKKLIKIILALLVVTGLVGCSFFKIRVGTVDIDKITKKWYKFQRYDRQFEDEKIAYSLLLEKASPNLTKLEKEDLQQRILGLLKRSNLIMKEVLYKDIKSAAAELAKKEKLKIIVIKQGVKYGGEEITDKLLEMLSR